MDKRLLLMRTIFLHSGRIQLLTVSAVLGAVVLAFVTAQASSALGSLGMRKAGKFDTVLFYKYISLSVFSDVLDWVISLSPCFIWIITERFISSWIFSRIMEKDLEEFARLKPEEHHVNFTLKKDALVAIVGLVFFYIPLYVIRMVFLVYKIVQSRPKSPFQAGILAVLLISIYAFLSVRAMAHRRQLKKAWDGAVINKNVLCKGILEGYEACIVEGSQKKAARRFKDRLNKVASHKLGYFIISENYRLLTRLGVALTKLSFVFLRMGDETVQVGPAVLLVTNLNSVLLELRNKLFMMLEYWSVGSLDGLVAETPRPTIAMPLNQPIALETPSQTVTLAPGSKTVIVGAPGVGKTTLLKSLIGESNEWCKASVGEVDLTLISRPSLYSAMSFLPQQQYMFKGSIEFNLLYGTGISPRELPDRLRTLGVLSYFDQFQDGLNTPIGSKATGLSNGQAQMICFLRCVLRDAQLYVFDEPGRHLDTANEATIYRIMSSFSDRTVVVASQSDSYSYLFDQAINLF